jgi:hypothetical protein
MGVEVAMQAIPLANKPLEAVLEVLDGAPVELLTFGVGEEVEGDFEFEVVLDHCVEYMGTVNGWPAGSCLHRTS